VGVARIGRKSTERVRTQVTLTLTLKALAFLTSQGKKGTWLSAQIEKQAKSKNENY
jgi:hypothetical protein